MTETQLHDLPKYRQSDALFAALRTHFDEAQVVELTAAISWENYRARFDHALGIEAPGFSDGADCVLPER